MVWTQKDDEKSSSSNNSIECLFPKKRTHACSVWQASEQVCERIGSVTAKEGENEHEKPGLNLIYVYIYTYTHISIEKIATTHCGTMIINFISKKWSNIISYIDFSSLYRIRTLWLCRNWKCEHATHTHASRRKHSRAEGLVRVLWVCSAEKANDERCNRVAAAAAALRVTAPRVRVYSVDFQFFVMWKSIRTKFFEVKNNDSRVIYLNGIQTHSTQTIHHHKLPRIFDYFAH